MNACPNCAHENRPGVLICEQCGRSLYGADMQVTRQMSEQEMTARAGAFERGTSRFADGASVILRMVESSEPVIFQPTRPTVLGRVSPSNPRKPDIDLRAYRAYEKGVSCYHATIYVYERDLVIADLGSTNGTYLNGQRLVPHQRQVLHDGDEIRLSNLVARVYFKNPN